MRGAVLLDPPAAAELADIDSQLDAAVAWGDAGYDPRDPFIKRLIDKGRPPMRGAAQGLNPAVFMNNVPQPGSYVINQQAFNLLTERNDVPNPQDAWPGYGGRIDRRIANVGVLTNIRLNIVLSCVVSGTGTVTSLYPFPFGLLKNVYLNANGGSQLIRCNGQDLRARRQRIFRNPQEAIATAPGMDTVVAPAAATPYKPNGQVFPGLISNGTYTINLVVDLPIVHDPASLTGALFAQSDQNYLNYVIETAQTADVFALTGNSTAVITGTVTSESTFFSIPSQDANNGRVVVLPAAVNWLHEFIATDQAFANTGNVDTVLIRNNGQLLCIYHFLDNGGAAYISPAALSYIQWAYAGNQIPRNYLPWHLLEENQRDYDGLIQPGALYYLLDFEKNNWQRDGVYPRGLSELKVTDIIPVGTTINANAHTHQVLETLTSG